MQEANGHLRKMSVTLGESSNPAIAPEVQYSLTLDDKIIPLNKWLGQKISLTFSGAIACVHCGRATKKSFNQGYCYPCFQKLAQCDRCIMSPEHCHFHQGTCREPLWGEQFCMTDHIVYLANSSGLKVGITRASQIPVRWIDQGAVSAIPFARVATRQQSGLLEVLLKQHVADKTNWRVMLKNEQPEISLQDACATLAVKILPELTVLQSQFGLQAIQLLPDAEEIKIRYPVLAYPHKVSSLNADKEPLISGRLLGIKGQYLLLDSGVINLRKYTGYHATFCLLESIA